MTPRLKTLQPWNLVGNAVADASPRMRMRDFSASLFLSWKIELRLSARCGLPFRRRNVFMPTRARARTFAGRVMARNAVGSVRDLTAERF